MKKSGQSKQVCKVYASLKLTTMVQEDSTNGYQAMLNTEPLGGGGVPLFSIVSCSIVEKNI
jgi:hypothetical protein